MKTYEYILTGFVFFTLIILATKSSNITGHVSAAYSVSNVKLAADSNQTYVLKIDEPITSVVVSGKVMGNGNAKVFLGFDDKRYLIYSRKVGNNLNDITGLATEDYDYTNEEKEVYLELLLGQKKTGLYQKLNEKKGYKFENTCMETCFLPSLQKDKYYLILETDLGTSLIVDKIVYTTE